MIPTVHSSRLTLRASRDSDLNAIAEFYCSDRSGWVGGPRDRARCWQTLAAYLGHWQIRGFGIWQLEELETGATVGAAGFMFTPGWDEPELIWHIYNGFEGKGFGLEAAETARQFGAENFGLNGVISYIAPLNTRSVKLAEKLGATFERETYLMGKYCHVYRHPKQEVPQ